MIEPGSGRRRPASWLPHLALVLLAVGLVFIHVRAVPRLSPIDEFQHADALHRAIAGRLTTTGDLVAPAVLDAASCRGVENVKLPPCGGPHQAADFPDGGYDTADIHPPGYYFATAWLSAPLRWAGVGEIDAGRLIGGLWLGLGLALLWELALAIGSGRAAAAAVCVLAATTVSVLEASSAIGPDSTAMAAGGLAMLAVVRVESGRWPLWTLALAGVLAGATKAHNLVGILAASVQRGLAGTAPAAVGAGLLLAAGAAAQLLWLAARHALGHQGGATIALSQAEYVSNLNPRDVVLQTIQFFTPVNAPFTPAPLANWQVGIIHYLLNLLLTGAVLGGVLFLPAGRARSLAVGVMVAALVGGPVLVVATFLTAHSYVPSFPRYGLSLLPGMFALLAVGGGRRLPLSLLAGLAALSLLAVGWFLVRAI